MADLPASPAAVVAGLAVLTLLGWGAYARARQSRQVATMRALEAGQSFFKEITNAVPVMIWGGAAGRGRLDYVNEVTLRYLGVGSAQEVAERWRDCVHPDDHRKLSDAYTKALRRREPFSVEFRLRRHDGCYRWQTATGTPRFDEMGRFIGHVGICSDITELRAAQEQAVRHSALLQSIIDAIPDAILLEDGNYQPLLANPAVARLFKLSDDDGAVNWLSLISPHGAGSETGREGTSLTVRYQRVDGSTFIGETLVHSLRDWTTGASGINLRIIRDVTDLVEAARAVGKARAAAEQANAAKSRFLAAASHDLRQPLQAINLFVESLSRRVVAPEERELVRDIKLSLGSLNEMFEHLLDISRLEAGNLPANIRDVSASSIIQSVVQKVRPITAERRLKLKVRGQQSLVRTDPLMLERILQNLVVNAVRYTESGGVLIGCRPFGDKVRIEVWDTGRGIPAEHMDNIFAEFFRLEHSVQAEPNGLGLGLSIVRRLSELLDHPIHVASRPGRGTVFKLDVPRVTEPPTMDQALGLSAARLVGKVVALLDEDPASLRETRCLLEGWGMTVVCGKMLGEGGKPRPDLIVAAHRSQGTRPGLAAVSELRCRMGDELPAIVLTDDRDPDFARIVRGAGCRLLHTPIKPIRMRSLMVLLVSQADQMV